MQPQDILVPVFSALVTLLIGSIPLVTAILKIHGVIIANKHAIALLEKQQQNADDLIALSVNQLKEKIEHTATRLRTDTTSLSDRVRDCENFLVKHQDFKPRNKTNER